MAKSPVNRCHQPVNDYVEYGDGFVRKLATKFSQATSNNEQRPASVTATNCSVSAWRDDQNCDSTSLFIPRTRQTNQTCCSNVVISTPSTTRLSESPTASDPTILTDNSTKTFTDTLTMQLTVPKGLSGKDEYPVGIVASVRRLFESLSSPVSSVPCSQSPVSRTSTSVTRQNTWQTSDSATTHSDYSSQSSVTGSSGSLSSQTNVYSSSSSSPDEFTDSVTTVDLISHRLDNTESRILPAAAATCDSLLGCSDVSPDVCLTVESEDAVKIKQLQTDHQVTTMCSMEDAGPRHIKNGNIALTSGEYHSNLLTENPDESMKGTEEITATMCFEELLSKYKTVSEMHMKIYQTSTSEYDDTNVLLGKEMDWPTSSTNVKQSHLSANEYGKVQTDCSFETQKSMRVEHSEDRIDYVDAFLLDSARAADRQLRTVARNRPATVKSRRPIYCSFLHFGSQHDDVVIETIKDPPRGLTVTLPPPSGNCRYVGQPVSLLISELRDQSVTVGQRTRVCRSGSDQGLHLRPCEYVDSADDYDHWHSNNEDLMTHLFTAALTPVTRVTQV